MCLSTLEGGGGYCIPGLGWGGVPRPGLDGRGRVPQVGLDGGGYPQPGLDGGGYPGYPLPHHDWIG